MEPSLGHRPIALDGFRGDTDKFRGFFNAEASEETEFDDSALAGVELGEAVEGIVELQELRGVFAGKSKPLVERQDYILATAFLTKMRSGIVGEDAAHKLSGHGEELRAALPIRIALTNQLQIGFMDESGGLQGVVGAFAAHARPREAFQFAVDQWSEAVSGFGVTLFQLLKQGSYIYLGWEHIGPNSRVTRLPTF